MSSHERMPLKKLPNNKEKEIFNFMRKIKNFLIMYLKRLFSNEMKKKIYRLYICEEEFKKATKIF